MTMKQKPAIFSSNRSGGKGGFDVYRFTPFNLKLIVNTNDTFSEKLIDYALVQVFEGTEKLFEGVTDETGKAWYFRLIRKRITPSKFQKTITDPLRSK